ncbi:1,6-anhydro-N-acetylmuramyl-L-alanine amidase AmpD [Simiduia agarivorans]|uniref:1,6-anhydro-N-acetylmuramyl-L-alanine amidase AmpD n=1 Tax=Simiduia agarivorans (strain DSM 21679 / JCM 13881 / BCRC 17597 / SA1) TaxID=1117647 RepID=K4KNY4_SIMAS|nr:N-acetyl-anhydromuranmyl-L-alanine amidase [Simiduia agarivorans SA1 = DSM 21679]
MTDSNSTSLAQPDDIWLAGARACISPNFNLRPEQTDVSLLVIHNISLPPGDFSSDAVERFFCNRLPADEHPYFAGIAQLQVSSHLFIRRSGELVQFVPLNRRAWHAGVSAFEGRQNCNDYSIGIELEGTDDLPYTQAQYDVLAQVTRDIQRLFPAINGDRIVGHNDIAPTRKTDPGRAFDWAYYRAMIGANNKQGQ